MVLQLKELRGSCLLRFSWYRPSTIDDDQIKALIVNNLHYMPIKLAEMLNLSKSSIHASFVKLGYRNRFVSGISLTK